VVGPIAYGCWRFAGTDVATARAKIETAVELGMTLIDTADIYGKGPDSPFGASEALLGRVLAESRSLRESIVLATKGGIDPGVPYHTSGPHMRKACEDSLKRLGVDAIDLYQVHRPDYLTHPEELAAALADLHAAGKVRAIGVSNYSTHQVEVLARALPVPIVTQQVELSAFELAPIFDGVLDQCMRDGLGVLAWSPLAGGRLEGAGRAVAPADAGRLSGLNACLDELAAARGVSRTRVALAFVLAHPARAIPIIGTQRLERMRDAAASLDCELERAEWYRILQAGMGKPLP
jgi:aryl-alcohol dehydrogenase-like predicted oxidoreductase